MSAAHTEKLTPLSMTAACKLWTPECSGLLGLVCHAVHARPSESIIQAGKEKKFFADARPPWRGAETRVAARRGRTDLPGWPSSREKYPQSPSAESRPVRASWSSFQQLRVTNLCCRRSASCTHAGRAGFVLRPLSAALPRRPLSVSA